MAKDNKVKAIASKLVEIIKLLKQKIVNASREMLTKVTERVGDKTKKTTGKANPAMINVYEKVARNVLAPSFDFGKSPETDKKIAMFISDGKNVIEKEKSKRIKEIDVKTEVKKVVNILKEIVSKLNTLEKVSISNELAPEARTSILARIKAYRELFSMSLTVFAHIIGTKSEKEDEKKNEACLDPGYAADGGEQKKVETLTANVGYADDGGKQKEVESLNGNADYAADGGKQLQVSLEELINDASRLLKKLK